MISGSDLQQIVEIALALVVFCFVLVAANLGDISPAWRVVAFAGQCGICAIVAVLALSNIATALIVPADVQANTGLPASRVIIGNVVELAGALVAPVVLFRGVRDRVARVLREFRPESAINAVGASLYVLVVTLFLSLQVSTDQLRQIKQSGQSPSLVFIIGTNQLPFLIVAVAGVGFMARRNPRQTLQRLGLYWPGWRWILGSAGAAVVLVIFGIVFDLLTVRLTPEQSKSIDEVSKQLLNNVNTWEAAVVLALAAGIGEEILFRGALMPRLGNALSALIFAVLHTQYAISLATLEIFLLGLALGWIRKRAGTTGSIIAHAGYDLILLLLPFALVFFDHYFKH
ncbi:MAG: protease family protein [Chloroflexota bacterium]|jgi:membrane protease YdiL (CAAX protease family)|nr:protease family protein [Chloroflexota bacterium]